MAPVPKDPPEGERRTRALGIWERAYRMQMRGDLDGAARLYKESIALFPTAEAHTFLGWTYSFQGKLDDAIRECERAIAVDPEFGNPYNDIGVYLIEKKELDQAIPWLEKAKKASRYEPRHFPFLNLGRIYAAKGMLNRAMDEFRGALQIAPGDATAARALDQLKVMMN
jgi:Tfp pilus assembly protein PilF